MSYAKKPVLIMFGGVSAEHEVSIISGLQVVEKIDRTIYEPHVVYIGKGGEMWYMGVFASRKDFLTASKKKCLFGKSEHAGGYIQALGAGGSARAVMGGVRVYPYAAFLAFHGGTGESGPVQGLLESCDIPHTGCTTEGAVITMNKQLTKQALAGSGVDVVPGVAVFAREIADDARVVTKHIIDTLSLPVIVKPVHLGSSIAITIARDEVTLEKAIIEAARIDGEILVEKLLTNFVEYNCSARRKDGKVEVSPIERPVSKDEILSFADKYQRGGGKKSGGSGMASLDREVPAQIPAVLKERIESAVKSVYTQCRMSGCPRVDFMYVPSEDTLYLTEPNPIPGSLAFYLWEAAGVPFQTQITDALEESVREQEQRVAKRLDYTTDIVAKFCAQ